MLDIIPQCNSMYFMTCDDCVCVYLFIIPWCSFCKTQLLSFFVEKSAFIRLSTESLNSMWGTVDVASAKETGASCRSRITLQEQKPVSVVVSNMF